jgi:hypothetical protein
MRPVELVAHLRAQFLQLTPQSLDLVVAHPAEAESRHAHRQRPGPAPGFLTPSPIGDSALRPLRLLAPRSLLLAPMAATRTLPPDWQELFDFLLPRREFLRVGDVASALNLDPKTIDELFAQDGTAAHGPRLHGYEFTARGDGRRPHKRIRRDSVILFLIERANHTPDEWRARLLEVLRKLPARELLLVRSAIDQLLAAKA